MLYNVLECVDKREHVSCIMTFLHYVLFSINVHKLTKIMRHTGNIL